MSGWTLAIIKPDAVRNRHTGKIIERILSEKFEIAAMRLEQLTRPQAEEFYAIHRERPFFRGLVQFMTSGPVVVIALQKDGAVEEWRRIIGATDPAKAAEGTIRKLFAENVQNNGVHGSDSDENAGREIAFFFPDLMIVSSSQV